MPLVERTRGLHVVSRVVALLLVGLLTLCPAVCGAEESGQGAHAHADAKGGPASPAHCPEDGGNCICQGAVQPDAVRIDHSSIDRAVSSVVLSTSTLLHPITHPSLDRVPTGLAGLGDRHAVRAFLQSVRC